MEIVSTPPQLKYHIDDSWWHLLQGDTGELYMLVQCEASFVSYERLIKLSAEELQDLQGLGWLSLQHLANRINYFGEEYKKRSITGPKLTEASRAVGLM